MAELSIEKIFERYEKSRERWILPIPVKEDGQLKLICFMNHDKSGESPYFDAYYIYDIKLIVLHNFLMEESCGSAYWKYIRCKEPRNKFGELLDSKRNIVINRQSIDRIIEQGETEDIIKTINKKFNDIGHTFTTHRYDDDEDDNEILLEDMGYDY